MPNNKENEASVPSFRAGDSFTTGEFLTEINHLRDISSYLHFAIKAMQPLSFAQGINPAIGARSY